MSELPATGAWPASAGPGRAGWPTVAGYEFIAELGRGGMGVVYKARQLSSNRLVALKLLRDRALAGPEELGRFRIEADAAARVRHPNVVEICEVGEHLGLPYFAMELVEGGSLDKHLAGQPQSPVLSANLMRTLALAVHYAHTQKVVHRDLKPSNILIANCGLRTADSATDVPAEGVLQSALRNSQSAIKIADFGLAKRLDWESTAWTQDGAILGTAGYMAPEQAAGRVRDIGPAVDVYALGAILYELLTGRPPFRSDTPNQTIEQVLHDEPVPPSRLQGHVPRDLETVCLKCLEKEPSRRYASAEELAEELRRFLDGQPVAAVPLSATERLARRAAQDGYQIIGEIGRGPQSTVYRAVYGPLKQPVALKVFAPSSCTPEEWETRLQRSTELWSSIAHPHIVPVQRTGYWDGAAYVASEYVPHGSLAARLCGQPYNIHQTLRLVEQLAEIVMYIHRQGIVHGNLKPSNVLLAADGIPRLTDFRLTGGLFVTPPREDDESVAHIGYLAPELVRDVRAEIKFNTDVYGLGMILYELLTGRPPFAAATAGEMKEQVCSQDPVPPSRLNSKVTTHMEATCLRCLRKNPWQRYRRAYDLLTRMQYFQDEAAGRTISPRFRSTDARGAT